MNLTNFFKCFGSGKKGEAARPDASSLSVYDRSHILFPFSRRPFSGSSGSQNFSQTSFQ